MVLAALGSGEKLVAVLPLAILSVGSIAGLSAMTNGDAATTPSPVETGTAAGSVGDEPASHPVHARVVLTSAPATISEASPPQVVSDAGPGPRMVDGQRASTAGRAGSPAGTRPATDGSAADERTTPAATASPTPTPGPPGSSSLTEAEATARCMASGISAADALSLGACVEDLLG